ncbi:MAG: glycosyltransferase family 2 protein [Gammaproteobacteria bacterium]|nr:glycosyltransferase family 2 protein [Gammaproteobacteria bacterium]
MDKTNETLCSVIITNYNGKILLDECLSSLEKQTYGNYEVIIVDNASTDGSVDFVKEKFPWVKIVESHINYGFAEGNNIGVEYANGDYIIFLNNDTEVEPHWLENMVNAAKSDPSIGIVGCKVLNAYQKDIIDVISFKQDIYGFPKGIGRGERDFGQYNKIMECFVIGASLLIKREVIEKGGCFDPKYFIIGEDLDLCWRTRLMGYKILVTPFTYIYHKSSSTISRLEQYRVRYYSKKNALRTLLKNYSGLTLLNILPKYFILLFMEMLFLIFTTKSLTAKVHLASADIKAIIWNLKNFKDTWHRHKEIQQLRIIDDATIQKEMFKRSLKIELFRKWWEGSYSFK